MLRYIIDAFNLVHRVKSLKSSDTPHRDLIRYIRTNKLTGSKNNKVIVVFDGRINDDALREKGDFEVVFSGQISADEIIKKRVDKIKNKSETVVVSDDRQIRDITKRQGARSCRIADFLKTKSKTQESEKEISYGLQHEITEELRRIWLKEEE